MLLRICLYSLIFGVIFRSEAAFADPLSKDDQQKMARRLTNRGESCEAIGGKIIGRDENGSEYRILLCSNGQKYLWVQKSDGNFLYSSCANLELNGFSCE